MEEVLAQREWPADGFTIANIAMADVPRLSDRFDGWADYLACELSRMR